MNDRKFIIVDGPSGNLSKLVGGSYSISSCPTHTIVEELPPYVDDKGNITRQFREVAGWIYSVDDAVKIVEALRR